MRPESDDGLNSMEISNSLYPLVNLGRVRKLSTPENCGYFTLRTGKN